MTRLQLERQQVFVYLAAVAAGLLSGILMPHWAGTFDTLLWPALGLLLFVTFTQVPLTRVTEAFRDRRFMAAMLTGNFLVVPLIVAGLLLLLPDDPAIRLGVLLVLLVPCTDWFITFAHLGYSDTPLAIASTPVNLLIQIALLPIYLWVFMGDAFLPLLSADRIVTVIAGLIVLPLAAAWLIERWAERKADRSAAVEKLAALPVPLLAIVVFLIAGSQVHAVADALPWMGRVIGLFIAFLMLAALAGAATARLFGLPPQAARTLIFSLGTRNSFVVLPLALALPPQWATAAIVIVVQSLVELFGMIVYLRLVPRYLAPETGVPRSG